MLDRYFKVTESGSTVRTEVLAGLTTFMTMAYILAVNPGILSAAGMDKGALFTATALSAAIATLVMSLVARLPFALAPGMGLNAFFAFGVVLGMGHSWQMALTAVFIEGLLFILLTLFNVREWIVNAIPMSLKHAISGGIGLFIAFIGMQNAGLIANHDAVLVGLGKLHSAPVLLMLGGVVLTAALLALRVKGALLIGIVAVTLAGIPLGVTHIPEGSAIASLPPSLSPILWKFDFSQVFSFEMLVIVFTFLFVDMFDTVGTLVGVSSKANMLDAEGRIPRVKEAFLADAIGTTAGAILGTSTVTTYVESAAGVAEGGRTGLTSLTVAFLFLVSLFFAPLFLLVPAAATAPALVLVGFFMMSPVMKIDFENIEEAFPAFVTLIMMPLTYSIAHGIVFGMLAYVLVKVCTGKFRDVSPMMAVLAILFAVKLYLG
jgi:AGZA family xanthine/uracil permease-like MFS transporter